jgi:hypothetical protein
VNWWSPSRAAATWPAADRLPGPYDIVIVRARPFLERPRLGADEDITGDAFAGFGNSGDDTVSLGSVVTSGTMDLGDSSDTLILASGTNTVTVANIEAIVGGSGADTVIVSGDLDVFLRSPNGRVAIIRQNSTTNKTSNVVLTTTSLTTTFAGSACTGTWGLYLRDVVKGNASTFNSTALTITKL